MAAPHTDGWIWVGLGVVTFITVHTFSSYLRDFSRFAVVRPRRPPPLTMVEATGALTCDALSKLARCYNHDLRISARNIICERTSSGPPFELLLQHVASEDASERANGLLGLKYLCRSTQLPKLATYQTFHALVIALEHFLQVTLRTSSPHQSQSERHALIVLSQLLPNDIEAALKAGVVVRWLARYPFGRTEAERHEEVRRIRTGGDGEPLLCVILGHLDNHPTGRKQMRNAGLIGSSINERVDDDRSVMLLDADEMARMLEVPRRVWHDTPELRRVRRRRREAVVVSDGGQPLSSQNIIQREDTEITEGIESTDQQTEDIPLEAGHTAQAT